MFEMELNRTTILLLSRLTKEETKVREVRNADSHQIGVNLQSKQGYLLFLNRLEDFNDTALIVCYIHSFKDFTVFTSAYFPHDLVVILLTEWTRRIIS
jgi:hypothetical protein